MRGFNFKSGEKPFKDFFKQGRAMSRFVFKKNDNCVAEGEWMWSDQVGGSCGQGASARWGGGVSYRCAIE